MYLRTIYRLKSRFFPPVIVPIRCEIKLTEHQKRLDRRRKVNRKLNDTYTYISSHGLRFQPRTLSLIELITKSRTEMELTKEIVPPEVVRGMTKLDKDLFETKVVVQCLCVPVLRIGEVTKCLKSRLLKITKVTPVVELETSNPNHGTHRLVLLHPQKFTSFESLSKNEIDKLNEIGLSEADLQCHQLKLMFENWTFQEILRAVISEEIESVSGHAIVGHIAHFNLRDEVLPYKKLIGEVLLEKQSYVKTVVNKLSNIDNTYRNFQMELLAGEENYITQTRENGCLFEMDFSQVYWNSRLSTEHERIVKQISTNEWVFDVFGGIGPFAIPAGKKKATVFANDLNPSSYESLVKNTKLNKLKDNVSCYNLDGREFITTIVKLKLGEFYASDQCDVTNVHIVMNLPALAYSFLDAFRSLLPAKTAITASARLPKVYCYCFTNYAEALEKWDGDMKIELKHRVIGVIGEGLGESDIMVRFVRNVAPNKDMMCVTFELTSKILLAAGQLAGGDQTQVDGSSGEIEVITEDNTVSEGPPLKMQKLTDEI